MSSVSSPPSSIIPFLVQQNGNIRLYHIRISDGDFGESCIKRIRALTLFSDANTVDRRFKGRVLLAITMRELVVGTVRVLELGEPGVQALGPKHMYKKRKDDVMTNFLLHVLTPVPSTKTIREHLLAGVQNDHDGYLKVWCYYHALSGVAAAIWLLMAPIIAAIVGLAVGGATGNGKLGLGVGGGLLAVLTTVQAAIIM